MLNRNVIFQFPDFSIKDDNYYLFKGILFSADAKLVSSILDLKFNQCGLKKDLILEKILKDLNIFEDRFWQRNKRPVDKTNQKIYLSLFKKILKLIEKSKDYRKNQQYAKFLYRMCLGMHELWQQKLVKYFIESHWKNNQNRALEYLYTHWIPDFSSQVISIWLTNFKERALQIIIWKIEEKYLSDDVLLAIDSYFKELQEQEEDIFEYDFQLKILRNKFYARFVEKYTGIVNEMVDTDPISYIYIRKEAHLKIDSKLAVKTYEENIQSRKYLPRWYAEMGMEEVLKHLIKQVSKDTKKIPKSNF